MFCTGRKTVKYKYLLQPLLNVQYLLAQYTDNNEDYICYNKELQISFLLSSIKY